MEQEQQVPEQEQPTAEATAPTQTEAPPESEAQGETKPEKVSDPVQKRINQLTWQKHEAERRLNAEIMARQQLEQQARALWQQQQEMMRRATMPTPEQFNLDPRQYQQAVEAHTQKYLDQQREAEKQEALRMQQFAARQQLETRLQTRINEGVSKFPDYQEVVGNPALPSLGQVNPALFAALLDHEQMPELTYYLGKNPGEAHRIAAMPPARAILEMGRIAAQLPTHQATKNAPPPPAQVGGNQRASTGPSDKDSMEEWLRKREAQLRKR